ncbi:MAG: hypothetical protein R2851_09220 [Caldilineaceae bacterium]
MSMPVVLDPDGVLQDLYQVSAMPTSYFIDRDGNITAIGAAVTPDVLLADMLWRRSSSPCRPRPQTEARHRLRARRPGRPSRTVTVQRVTLQGVEEAPASGLLQGHQPAPRLDAGPVQRPGASRAARCSTTGPASQSSWTRCSTRGG